MTKADANPDSNAAPDDGPDEATLVAQAKEGDLDAYNTLIERYHSRIYQLVYNMTSNKEDAEDMVQEVFIKAFKALPRFQGKSSFYTWIYRIGINQTINYVKKRNRRRGLSLDEIDHGVERDEVYVELSSKHSPFRDATLSEIQEKLNEAIQDLSEKHRTVVILHDIQGVPHDTIGEMLDISSGTVRSRLYYARQHLQAALADLMN